MDDVDESLRVLMPEMATLAKELDIDIGGDPRQQSADALDPVQLTKLEDFLGRYRQALS
jgi:hypothetical protein